MKLRFKNQKSLFYVTLGIYALIAILAIVYFITDIVIVGSNISYTDRSWLSFIFLLLGAICGAIYLLFSIDFLSPISSILVAGGVAVHLYQSTFPWADLATAVPFFTNNEDRAIMISSFYTVFLVIFVLLLLYTIVINFFSLDNGEE